MANDDIASHEQIMAAHSLHIIESCIIAIEYCDSVDEAVDTLKQLQQLEANRQKENENDQRNA